MKKTLLLFSLFTSFCLQLAAQEISFVQNKNWKQILELAKQKNMPIFFDAYASWCGPCKYMESSVYTAAEVAGYYNANFINVKMDMEEGEGPRLSEEFNIGSYPTFLFISPSGKIVHRAVGAMKPADFISLGRDAKNPSKQYYTLKEQARLNRLGDADFATWAAAAKRLGDEDLADYAAAFLATKKDILVNEDVATIALKYADSLTDAQMTYLVSNEAKLGQVLKLNRKAAAEAVYNRLFKQALRQYKKEDDRDKFRAVIRKFDAKRENLAVKELDLRVAIYVKEDTEKAASLLADFLTGNDRLSLEETAGLLMENLSELGESDHKLLAERLSSFRPSTADAGKEAWLYLMLTACYYTAGETEKAKDYGLKAYQQGGLDEDYQKMLKELFGFK